MTARTGMSTLIRRLRGLTHSGTADYSVDSTTWWTDDQMQEVLDANRRDYYRVPLREVETYDGGTLVSYDYYTGYGNLEEMTGGSAVWDVEDGSGNSIGTASYTPNYINGVIRFSADASGTSYYWSGRSYDLNAAAAQVWREKAAWRAGFISFSADDQSFSQAQWFAHCQQMAGLYEASTGIRTAELYRSDLR